MDDEFCVNADCACHRVEAERVVTPFPIGYGPIYCCNKCACIVLANCATVTRGELMKFCGQEFDHFRVGGVGRRWGLGKSPR